MTTVQHPLETTEALAPEHAEIIRATLPTVGGNIEDIARVFYRRMFTARPDLLRDLFNRGNQAQGAQQKALASSVATYATLLVTPNSPSPRQMLGRIGHKHASLGLTEDQYSIVHEHLMAGIVEVLGEDLVTDEVAAAWSAVYWNMAAVLIDFEKDLYAQAGVAPGDVFRTAVVAERIDESDSVTTFVLIAREGDEELGSFTPGQYISVGVRLPDGARQLRQYSLSNAPGDGRWRISVKREDGGEAAPLGEVSNWLLAHLRAGDELQVTLPFGDLALDIDSETPVVLISNGIGATPMLGMLSHIAKDQPHRPVTVLHADRDARDAALVEEMVTAVEKLPATSGSVLRLWFRSGLDEKLSSFEEGRRRRASERASEGLLSLDQVAVAPDAEVYLCGSNGFLQGVRGQLAERNVATDRVHYELFSPNDWLLPTA